MKHLFALLLCVSAAASSIAQCPVGPPQVLQPFYEYLNTKFRNSLQIPRHAAGSTCRDTAQLWYNPVDSNLYGWTGTQFRCLSCGTGSLTAPGLPVQSVQFNSGPGVFRGSSHLTWDTAKSTLNADSVITKQAYIGNTAGNFQYPLVVKTSYGGYGGILVQDSNSSGSAATRITLRSRGGHELQLSQLDESFATAASVIASTSQSDFVFRADAGNMIWEMGPVGALIGEIMRSWFSSANLQIGKLLGFPKDQYDHKYQLYIASQGANTGALLTNRRIDVSDEGSGYAVIGAYNQLGDSTYVRDAGIEHTVYTLANPRLQVWRLEPTGIVQQRAGLCAGCHYNAQPDIDPSAVLQGRSTTQGFLAPRMNDAQMKAIVSPATGLVVWNTDFLQLFWYNGTSWSVNKANHDKYAPTTGGSVQLLANDYSIINPAGTLANLNLALPFGPKNNDFIEIKFTQSITTLTFSAGTIQTPPAVNVIGYYKFVYDSATTTWY